MGTRADFYVGRGPDAEWLGSIAWDGDPRGIVPHLPEQRETWPGGPVRHKVGDWPAGKHLFDATTEQTFRERLERFFQYRDDVTRPVDGWPWPWDDSNTTDYAYAFDGGRVIASCFGHAWFDPRKDEPDDTEGPSRSIAFPDMSGRKNVTFGPRSGVIVISVGGEAHP